MVFISGELPKDDISGFDVFGGLLLCLRRDGFGVVAEIEDEVGAPSMIDVSVGDEHSGVHAHFYIFLNSLLEVNPDWPESANDDIRTRAAIRGDISHRVVDLVICAGVLGGLFELGAGGFDDWMLGCGGGRLARLSDGRIGFAIATTD